MLKTVIAIWLFLIVITSITTGKTITVPDQYKKIQEALNQASHGDTVFVRNGTYKESSIMPTYVVLTGEDCMKTIIRGRRRKTVVKVANHSVINNFTITKGGIGILSENTNALIQNNIISNNTKTGIQTLISLPVIKNNIIIDNGWSGVFCELVAYGTRSAVENNAIIANGYCGVMLSRKSGVLIQNNLFMKNKQYGIYVSEDSRISRILYNNFYSNRREYNDHARIDNTNISVDPEYPNSRWEDFYFMQKNNRAMHGKGKNGVTIGILTEGALKALFKDTDEDGIADRSDQCPDMAEDIDNFEDKDGCPDNDNDGDGLYDIKDKCPHEAEDFDGFQDLDGCPDSDNDRDLIPDSSDKCPNKQENINGIDDSDGCPD